MAAHFLKVALMALFVVAAAPEFVRAQDPLTVTLKVPLKLQDLPATVTSVVVECDVWLATDQATSGATQNVGPVVNGAYSGTATVVVTHNPLVAGQQLNYRCQASFVTAGGVRGFPGIDAWAALAPTSGPNLVQGIITTK